jgi:hypothetical protein
MAVVPTTVFHWGLPISIGDYRFPLGITVFHWGLPFSIGDNRFPLGITVFHWGLPFSIGDYRFPLGITVTERNENLGSQIPPLGTHMYWGNNDTIL